MRRLHLRGSSGSLSLFFFIVVLLSSPPGREFQGNASTPTVGDKVVPKRADKNVNGHHPLIALLVRCNHDVKLTFLDQAYLLSFVHYATKYMTKNDQNMKRIAAILRAATEAELKYRDPKATPAEQARSLLARCCSRLRNDVELPAAAAAYYLLYGEDHFTSELFAPLSFGHALSRVRSQEMARRDGVLAGDGVGSDELFSLRIDDNGNEVIEYNQLDDYTSRPSDLEDVSFYDFVSRFAVDGLAKEVSRSAGATRRYSFLPSHPRAATHRVKERERAAVPVLRGPSVPDRDHNDPAVRERYARSILVLFKPWRSLDDLLAPDSAWTTALASVEPDAAAAKKIANLQLLHSMKASAVAMRKAHESLGDNGRLERDVNDPNLPSGVDADATEVERQAVAEMLLAPAPDSATWVKQAMEKLRQGGRFTVVPSPTAVENGASGSGVQAVRPWLPSDGNTLADWQATLVSQDEFVTRHRRSDQPQDTPSHPQEAHLIAAETAAEVFASAEHGAATAEAAVHLAQPGTAPHQSATPIAFARRRGLNKKQTLAFTAIAVDQLDRELDPLHTAQHMFVVGAAGCGKSVVLETVAAWMKERGRASQLRLTASTGTAAAKITGMTLHSLIGSRRVGKQLVDDPNIDALSTETFVARATERVRAELEGVTLICCDEVGMVGHNMMNSANAVLSDTRPSSGTFGGISTVWFGDFAQFPPVSDTALYCEPKASGTATANLRATAITACVVLDEPMRQAPGEVELLRILSELRTGNCSDATYNLLNKRVVGGPVTLRDPVFADAKLLTARHSLRREYNMARAVALASRSPTGLLVSVAAYRNIRSLSADDISGLRTRSPTHHDSCDPVVPLHVGMPVIVNRNLHTGQGITNGSYGVVTAIVLVSEDAARLQTADRGKPFILGSPPPLVIVKMQDSHPFRARLDGLAEDEVPIVPVAGTAKPTSKKSVRFRQLPISPAYAVTDYRSQGASEDAVIVDLAPPSRRGQRDPRPASYVVVSRVRTLRGLAILRSFDKAHLGSPIGGDLESEFRRERVAEAHTLRYLETRMRELGWWEEYERYIVLEKGYSCAI